MKNMRRGLLAIAIALFFLSGCESVESEAQEENNRIVLGFAQLGDESEWRTSSSNDIKRAAAEAGVQLFFENAQQKQFNETSALRINKKQTFTNRAKV